MSPKTSPLSEGELRFVRFWHAATVIAKKVMIMVLLAFTQGKISNTYRDELIRYYDSKPNKHTKKSSEALYKKEFTNGEQLLLEDPTINPERFDVTLIDKLMRRLHALTGLAYNDDAVWTVDEPAGTNSSIEYLIYQVKCHRNNACHNICDLSESELTNKLNELKTLYTKLVDRVLKESGESPDIICKKTDEIKNDFANLKKSIQEVLTDEDFEAYLKEKSEVLKMLQTKTKLSCQLHLKKLYEDTYETNIAEWLDISQQVETEQVFTELIIKQEQDKVLSKRANNDLNNMTEKRCHYKDILTITTKTMKSPKILTITAVGGNGKTTYTRLFVCKWSKGQSGIPELDKVDILMFIELRSLS
ncbi:unnamed protein product, partial [Meganyctiphanes norvegica]